jgi:hypothetical protein
MSTSPIGGSTLGTAADTQRAPLTPTGVGSGDYPVLRFAPTVNSVDVNTTTDVILIGALAAVWLAAGLLADGLPVARTANELRRRAALLSMLVGGGAVIFVAVPLVTAALPGESAAPAAALLAAVPAMVVLTTTVRRLGQVRRGAGAFETAPQAPVPPGLRAAAAHPLVAAPLQVTGLGALIGLPIAAGLVTIPGADMAGVVVTVAGLIVAAIGIRHGLRHSRLNLRVVAPLKRSRKQIA